MQELGTDSAGAQDLSSKGQKGPKRSMATGTRRGAQVARCGEVA